ncbi:MAG: 1-deoxy-D-xylulose-5-phosphate reductoisomerase [Clostridia bacterium]|nr:1-deoxy-D-xylulose-5-phosphate reductoisomerase [Clostridia bacterium]
MICNKEKMLVLGSTGSIGEQALDVAKATSTQVVGICAGTNWKRVEAQAREYNVRFAAMFDTDAAAELKTALSDTDIRILAGVDGICEMIAGSGATFAVNSIIGQAGLLPTLAVLEAGIRLALANKESLVVAGEIVMEKAREKGIEILPIDSEHCAIHQCLRSGKGNEIKKIILTASGGPFFGLSREEIYNVPLSRALAHPTWRMGAKITIDSATLMNKGFEIIEAAHLFGVGPDKIDVLVHRESIIHSMVEYIDNSVIAQLSTPDMRHCVQYALDRGARKKGVIEPLDLAKISKLTFARPDREAFPLLDLALYALDRGGATCAVLNAANEVAVAAYLSEKIAFGQISDCVCNVVYSMKDASKIHTLEGIFEADREARELAKAYLNI